MEKRRKGGEMQGKKPYIKVTKDGPYMVFGIEDISEKLILADEKGISVSYGDGRKFDIRPGEPVALCRCGRSETAPFCDSSHLKPYAFDGTETAGFRPYMMDAERLPGPDVDLLDNERFCAFARFCDAAGRIWNLVEEGGEWEAGQARKEADLCPAGRLIILDKAGRVLEDRLPPSIALIEDAKLKISGPVWVRGGIRVESEYGESYEVRMKQTLCRCGRSSSKPFCNGAHASAPGWRAKSGR